MLFLNTLEPENRIGEYPMLTIPLPPTLPENVLSVKILKGICDVINFKNRVVQYYSIPLTI